jgi:hypothetical protein
MNDQAPRELRNVRTRVIVFDVNAKMPTGFTVENIGATMPRALECVADALEADATEIKVVRRD